LEEHERTLQGVCVVRCAAQLFQPAALVYPRAQDAQLVILTVRDAAVRRIVP
jgi:hypothetical protein